LGESVDHFPLYIAEALVVEALGLVIAARERPYRFGVLSGIAIGTVGVLAEYGWSHVWMPLPWPSEMLGEAVALGVVAGVAGGVLGAFAAAALAGRSDLVTHGRGWLPAVGGLVAAGAVFVYLGHTTAPDATVQASLTTVRDSGPREVVATVRFDPPEVTRDPDWLYTVAWQGGEPVRTEPLDEVSPGVYRSAPLPVSGTWKTSIRLQSGSTMGAVAVFAPKDTAIPAAEISAPARFERQLGDDRELLQRERKDGVPDWSIIAFGLAVAAFVAALLLAAGVALVRVSRTGRPPTVSRTASGNVGEWRPTLASASSRPHAT
jgi:hypothetical protein